MKIKICSTLSLILGFSVAASPASSGAAESRSASESEASRLAPGEKEVAPQKEAITKASREESNPEVERNVRLYFQDVERVIKEHAQSFRPEDRPVLAIYGEKIVPYVESYLTNSESRVRMEALGLLAKAGGERAAVIVGKCLSDPHEQVQSTAVQALSRTFRPADVKAVWEPLRPQLLRYAQGASSRSGHPHVAVFLLERIGGSSVIPELKALQKVPEKAGRAFNVNIFNRGEACRVALARLGDQDAAREVRKLLKSNEPHLIVEGIKDASELGRAFAADVLDLLEDKRIVPDLESSGSNLRYRVCEWAAIYLPTIGHFQFTFDESENSAEEASVEINGVLSKILVHKQAYTAEWVESVKQRARWELQAQ